MLDTTRLEKDLKETKSYRKLVQRGYDPQLLDIQLRQMGYIIKQSGNDAIIVGDPEYWFETHTE